MIPLRIYKYKKMSSANEITVHAYYKTPEDEDASKSEDERYQGKGKKKSKGKSKAERAQDTVRPTLLVRESSGIDTLGSDPFIDFSDREPPLSPTLRDSVTQHRVNAKRDIEKDFSPKEVSRAEIFAHNTCSERLYNNQKKYYYIIKKARTHHRIDIKR
ncbi:hypothetical protein BKA61DRAFT_579764 [Leptodontidium sp. MPI-SDFR-AT-0119]|nr:hypothetical protein BKA61DRAFT_579764 [Leptodontidium sp. MPI-SDFR-AT-0119]